MEHTLKITFIMLFLTAALVLSLFALTGSFPKSEEEPTAAATKTETEEPMVLGVFEGKLALFIGESRYPSNVYDFFVRNLPQKDRENLERGIEVQNKDELFKLLEDFMS